MLLGLFESVGLSLDIDDLGVVYQAIHQGDNAGSVGKDLTPFLEGPVGRDQSRSLFVTPRDDLKQQVGVTVGVGKIPDLID